MSATYNIPGNINACGGELQEVKFQNLNSTPENVSESRFWYDSVNHVPMYHNGTSAVVIGANYTFLTGLTNTSGTITVTDYNKLLKNIATGTNSLTVLGNATSGTSSIGIGYGTSNSGDYSVAIGEYATAHENYNVAIGAGAYTTEAYSIAIGAGAGTNTSSLGDVIQLGYGTNSESKTFSVGFYNNSSAHKNWKMLDGLTGYIPNDRIQRDTTPTSSSTNAITSGAVYTSLGNKLDSSLKGAANGVAELDANGKIPSSQLPGTLDDVVELLKLSTHNPATCSTGDMYFNTTSNKIFTATGTDTWGTTGVDPEKSVIYVALDTNFSYRWGGSTMINIANPVQAATELTAGIAEIASSADMSYVSNDTKIVTPLKLANYVSGYVSSIKAIKADNPALTVSGGVVTWEISNAALSKTNVANVRVFNKSTGETIFAPWKSAAGKVVIEMLASANVSAETYRAIVLKVSGLD